MSSTRVMRKRAQRRAAGIPQIGDAMQCADCRVSFEKARPRQRFCPACGDERQHQRFKKWREKNPDKRRAIVAAGDARRKACPKRQAAQRTYSSRRSLKRSSDPKLRLDHRVSQMVLFSLRGGKAGRTWQSILGFNLDELTLHIERQFEKGMSWKNMGDWHIDHIVPKASFSYASEIDDEFRACWSLTNLRPMWSKENMKKGARRTLLI